MQQDTVTLEKNLSNALTETCKAANDMAMILAEILAGDGIRIEALDSESEIEVELLYHRIDEVFHRWRKIWRTQDETD